MEYKGWQIECVFNYADGKSDWQIYHKSKERGELVPSMTYEELKQHIDEKD